MVISIHLTIFAVSLLLLSGIVLSKFTSRFGIPVFLTFLLLGLFFGNGGEYDFEYNYPYQTLNIAQIALCMILFSGGLNTDFKEIRPILSQSLALSTLGVLLTMFIAGGLIHYSLEMPLAQSLLLGAIISSTDAAAVFSILESKGLKLKENTSQTLEVESGTNDPMAYFLTISLTEFAKTDNFSILDFSFHFLYNLGMGFLIGLLLGYVAIWSLKLLKLKVGLSPVWVFMLILFTFSATELLHANSFLAVYVVGIVIGNFRMNNAYLANFFEGIAWLMEILLFLALGLQVFLQDLPQIAFSGLVVSLILIFIARPLGVLLSWSFFPKISWQKRFYVSWVGLRGATPIVFALYPIIHQVPEANLIFNITFFVVLSSVVIQGFTVSLFAKWLKMNQ